MTDQLDTTTAAPAANFGFGADEAELRDVVRRYLAERFPVTKLRELVASDHTEAYEAGYEAPWDRDVWNGLVDIGVTALAAPEDAGGTPVSTAGLAAIVEEAGVHALPSPLAATLGATLVLRRCEEAAAQTWLATLAKGATATLATTDQTGSWKANDCTVDVASDGAGYRLTGTAAFVQEAAKVDHFVVLCRTDSDHHDSDHHDSEHLLVVVPSDAAGLTVERDQIHDLTRDQASLHFDSVVVDQDAVVSKRGSDVLEQAWPAVLVLAAADLCGAAEWLLQTTVEYATNRVQFDRPIGFFQAVKHPIVNVMIETDRAKSLVYHAASLIDVDDDGALVAARMAKSAASDAASFAADRTVQLHGGIGFTWEHDAHLYFKRAMHGQALYGDGRYQRQLLADLMMGPIS